MVGAFTALSQLGIAPAIINGVFYALLAIVAGSAIIAIGGGGIVPMRAQWEKALDRITTEAPRLQAELQSQTATASPTTYNTPEMAARERDLQIQLQNAQSMPQTQLDHVQRGNN